MCFCLFAVAVQGASSLVQEEKELFEVVQLVVNCICSPGIPSGHAQHLVA